MVDRKLLYVPLELAELLHATLGPLGEVLERDGHSWAQMVRRVLDEYTRSRNSMLSHIHGDRVISEVTHQTFLASERVCELTDMAIREEEDFLRWSAEVDGDR